MRRAFVVLSTLVMVAIGSIAVASHNFTDVDEGNIFHDDIAWMYDNGITYGYGDGTYGPKDFMTREQMAAFMHRLYNRIQQDIPEVPSTEAIAEAFAEANINIDSICEIFDLEPGDECAEGLATILRGPQGPQGEPGQDGVDGEDGVDGQDGVSGYSVHGTEVPIAPGDFKVTKECKDGKVAIGGGFRVFPHGQDSREDVTVTVSSPGELVDTKNGWIANAWEVQGHHAGSQNATLDVQVICADIATDTPD